MSPNESILSLHHADIGFLRKKNSIRLLTDINLQVPGGELIGLVGRNGSGKSTILRTLVRLQPVLQGEIRINSRKSEQIHSNEFAKIMAYVASGLEFSEGMTVRELVSLGRFPFTNWIGRIEKEDKILIDQAIQSVGIESLSNKKLIEISDGERQKAMIARTLAQNSQIIILDEPTAFLDLPSKYDIINLLYELTRNGKTIIYSTHDLNIAMRFSDKIWLIDNNTIRDGSPEDLVLNKTLATIFDSDKIKLNDKTGDFDLNRNFSKSISLKAENSELFYWTKQAMQRSGYEVVEYENENLQVQVFHKEDKIIWKISSSNVESEVQSIYQLISELNKC